MMGVPDLNDLVAGVVADAAADDPLERLAAAARTRDELAELAEALLDHFVEQAREAGCSWREVGDALGVSKQAAQQRHAAPASVGRRLLLRLLPGRAQHGRGLFGRFTDRARGAIVLAREEARSFDHDHVGTEHVLLGLIREGEGVAARALESMNVSLQAVREQVEEIIGRGEAAPPDHIPFTPRAKKVLELSLRESLKLGHDYIGTEHILLGLLRVEEGVAARILTALGVDQDRARETVLRIVEGGARPA